MEWFPLDDALIGEALNPKEAEAVLRLRGEAAADPVPGICRGLAARIRNCVLSGGRARLQGGETEIPMALRGEATAILRVKLQTRFALSITEERKREAEAAEQRLDGIARGEYPLPDGTVAATPSYHGRPLRWQSPQGGGIM